MLISKPHVRKGKNVFSYITEETFTVDCEEGHIDIEFVTNELSPESVAKRIAIRFGSPEEAEDWVERMSEQVSEANTKFEAGLEMAKDSRAQRVDKLRAELERLENLG